MVQVVDVDRASGFGRLARSFAQGLEKGVSENFNENLKHARKSRGLQELAKSEGLSPTEFMTKAMSIQGLSPEETRGLFELSKQQNIKNAYGKGRQGAEELKESLNQPMRPEREEVRFANLPEGQINKVGVASQTPNVMPEEQGQPQILKENPLREKAIPRGPWTPEEKNADRAKVAEQFPWMTPQEVTAESADNERRALSQPEVARAQDEYFKKVQAEATEKLDKALEKKLQKKGEGIYADITGEMKANIERGMERDLRTKPNATVDDIVNDWSNRALNTTKAKSEFKELVSGIGVNTFFKGKKVLGDLNEYSKIFKKSGSSEEYYKMLQSDIGLTPQGAASIAYPRSDKLKDVISKYKYGGTSNPINQSQKARQIALEVAKSITSDDSVLAVMKDLRDKDPFFDQDAFIEELKESDSIRLNDRLERELAKGKSDIFKNWADLLIFPVAK